MNLKNGKEELPHCNEVVVVTSAVGKTTNRRAQVFLK
jgi:aspartokinase